MTRRLDSVFRFVVVLAALLAPPALGSGQEAPDAGVAAPEADLPPDAPAPDAPAPDADAPPDAPAPDADAPPAQDVSDEDLLDEIADEIAEEEAPAAEEAAPPAEGAARGAEAEEPGEATLTLPEAVVTYTQEDVFRTGGGVSLVDQEELETFEYSDPNSVLLRVPGVYVRSEDGFGLRPNIGIRGTRPDRSSGVTLMEDGILFGPAPYSAPAAYYFPLITRMVGVEVFKGPSAILYGPQTVGGAVNLLTREVPVERSGEIDLSYGLYNNRKLHLHYGASNRWGGILFEGLNIGSTGFKDIDFVGGPTGFDRTELMLRSFVQSDPNGRIYNRLDLKLGFSHELSHETYLGLSDADFREDPYRRYLASSRDRMRWNRYQVELLHRLSIGSDFDLFTSVYRHDFHRVWRRADHMAGGDSLFDVLTDPSTPQRQVTLEFLREGRDTASLSERIMLAVNDRQYVSQGIQSSARYRFTTGEVKHQIEGGVRFHYDEIDRDHSLEAYEQRNQELVRAAGDAIPTTDEVASAFAFSAHAMYALEVARVRLTPGLRTEVVATELEKRDLATGTLTQTTGTQAVVLPGLGANYAITDWLGGFAGVHRGFAPVAPGQPDTVDPELSISVEGGVRVQHEELGMNAELVGFYNDYSNMLLTCGGFSGCLDVDQGKQFNAGSVNIGGIEALFGQSIRITDDLALPVRFAYTFTQARLRDVAENIGTPDFAGAEDGDFVPYVPQHQLSADLGVDWDDLGVRFTGTYVGEMLEQAGPRDEGLVTDDYLLVDAVADYEIRDRATVYVRLENLTNREPIASRRPFGARPARPFTAQLGLKVDL